MIKGKIFAIVFVLLLIILFFLKYERYIIEKFNNIDIVSARINIDVNKENQKESKDLNSNIKMKMKKVINKNKFRKVKLVKNNTPPDYKNDTILLSCFDEKNLKTFNKYESYSTKLYFKIDNDVAGEVWITPSHVIEHLPQITLDGYFLNNLCVKKKYRKRGVARSLLNKVIEKAKKENKLHIILHVNSGEKPYLVDFYESVGFKTYSTGINKDGKESKLMFNKL